MALTLSDYLDSIGDESFKPKARLTFLRMEDESPYHTITGDIIDGNLQVTRNNGVRRSCNITMINEDGEYIPNPYAIWVNRKFLLELGIERIKYEPQTVWQVDIDGEELRNFGRNENTGELLGEGTLTNTEIIGEELVLSEGFDTGEKLTKNLPLSEVRNVNSTVIEWEADDQSGTIGDSFTQPSGFESGTLFQTTTDSEGLVLDNDPSVTHSGTWRSWLGLSWRDII